MKRARWSAVTAMVSMVALAIASVASTSSAAPARSGTLTPVMLFPAFHFTKLEVTVAKQTAARECPRSGTFQDWYQDPHPSKRFSQVCRDELMTLRYDPNPRLPMPKRFSEQRGVTVTLLDYGKTASAPFYQPLYRALQRSAAPACSSARRRAT